MSVPAADADACADHSGLRPPGAPGASGTRERNHCPHCLHSRHVDLAVGDRRSLCGGVMSPISLWIRDDGEVALIHRCRRCGTIKANRVAGDDNEEALARLAEPLIRMSGAFGRPAGFPGRLRPARRFPSAG
jgi:hypothetical protein